MNNLDTGSTEPAITTNPPLKGGPCNGPTAESRTLLNLGAGYASPPPLYRDWKSENLDLNPLTKPDHCCDVRYIDNSSSLKERFDSVYLSHLLEHFLPEEVPLVLRGALYCLKKGSFAFIRVPSVELAMQELVDTRKGLDDPIKAISDDCGTPVTYRMVVNGITANPLMTHHSHFSRTSLIDYLEEAGFEDIHATYYPPAYEIIAVASKGPMDEEYKKLLDINNKEE